MVNKDVLKKNCEYRYIQGMNAEAKFLESFRGINPDFLDRILQVDGITTTDFFLLRGVMFFRIATPEMLVDYLN